MTCVKSSGPRRGGPGPSDAANCYHFGPVKRSPKYIVSDERAFIYFVVPKVACSSLKTALLPLFPDIDPGPDFEREVREDTFAYRVHDLFARAGHQVNQRRLLKGFEKGRYDGYFKFAFVRNPWDRLLSCWKQKLAPGGPGLAKEEYAEERLQGGISFSEFVEAVCRIPDEEANPHFRSQHVAVCGPSGEVMADFVGRFERLEEDFSRVASEIGAVPSLPRLLASGRGSYRDYYDGRLARMVGERFSADAEIFGYRF